jgi:alpha-beta hydrolase superfamily lysophospholipase
MTFGYDADVIRPMGRVGQNTVLSHASNFMNYLRNKRDGPLEEKRPLIFVAHSLGGLVCEQVRSNAWTSP